MMGTEVRSVFPFPEIGKKAMISQVQGLELTCQTFVLFIIRPFVSPPFAAVAVVGFTKKISICMQINRQTFAKNITKSEIDSKIAKNACNRNEDICAVSNRLC